MREISSLKRAGESAQESHKRGGLARNLTNKRYSEVESRLSGGPYTVVALRNKAMWCQCGLGPGPKAVYF